MVKSLNGIFLKGIPKPCYILVVIFFMQCLFIFQSKTAIAQSNITYLEVTRSTSGSWGNGQSSNPSLSTDGRFLIFATEANNLAITPSSDANYHLAEYDTLTKNVRYIESFNAPILNIWLTPNGRFIYIETPSTTIEPKSSHSIYVFDRVTQDVKPFDISNIIGINRILHLSASEDGRYLTFLTKHPKNGSDNELAPVLLDTYTNQFIIIPIPKEESIQNVHLSADSKRVTIATLSKTTVTPIFKIYQYDRISRSLDEKYRMNWGNNNFPIDLQLHQSRDGSIIVFKQQISESKSKLVILLNTYPPIEIDKYDILNFQLSPNGNYIAFIARNNNLSKNYSLYRYNISLSEIETIDTNLTNDELSIISDGSVIAYTKYESGVNQIFLANINNSPNPKRYLSGQILAQGETPLGLVSVTADNNIMTKTDSLGYFFLPFSTDQTTNIQFYKKGFEFTPKALTINGDTDINHIKIIAQPTKVLDEATKDLGMPYHFDRGCSSPFIGCGGPFHGFYAGYCTDLILDTYLWGVDFNIQTALEHDALSNPTHIYTWRNARNAHDMWRFFAYTGQLLPSESLYYPGDIVFFDWDENGEIDHVSLIAETYSDHTPRYLYDATGVIESNPSGLTAKLPWEPFHTRTLRGHARWNGLYIPPQDTASDGTYIQISTMGDNINIRAVDEVGILLSDTGMPTRNIVTHFDFQWEKQLVITINDTSTQLFSLYITNLSEHPANIIVLSQILHQNFIVNQVQLERTIKPNSIFTIPFKFQIKGDSPQLDFMFVPPPTHRIPPN